MHDSVFWLKMWMTAAIGISLIVVATTWYNDRLNTLRFSAWQECLKSGGEPKDVGIVGSDQVTFTCEMNK